MTSLKAVFAILNADATLIATVPKTRIFPSIIPIDSVLPAIAVSLVSSIEDTSIAMTEQVNRDRVQITVASKKYSDTADIIQKVNDALNHKQGTFATIKVHSIIKDNIGADFRDDEAGVFYSTIDFKIDYV